jgi:uncharacterized protein (TIGR00255 family)
MVSSKLERGRVEISVFRASAKTQGARVRFDSDLFDALLKRYEAAWKRGGLSPREEREEMLTAILARREVLDVAEPESSISVEHAPLMRGISAAVGKLCRMRALEGQRLGADIAARLTAVDRIQATIERERKKVVLALREKLQKRIASLSGGPSLDASRVAQEVALLADRSDIHEELVRIVSHSKQIRAVLQTKGAGRKLEFLFQELGREFNTIGSKAQDAGIQHLVVDAKGELEKMREQVQNLE